MKMGKPSHKMTKLIVSAIRNLRDHQGSTTKDILNYVMRECNPEPTIERRLRTALKRGLEYGILRKKDGHYLMNTDAEILTDQVPMERNRRRRRRKKRGGKKSGKKGRARRKRRSARRARGKSRSRKARRRGSRRPRRNTRGKTMRKRGGVDDIDILNKEPLEAPGPRTDVDQIIGQTYEGPRSRSRSRQSRQSRSRSPSHSQSSDSSDRDAHDGRRQAD